MPAKMSRKRAMPRRRARTTARKAAPAKKTFGRSGMAGKAEGDAAVRAWIAGIKPEQRPIVEKLDALIGDLVPGVKRAVKWSMPFYGLPGQGWIAHVAAYKDDVTLGFFSGASLDPPPPMGEGKGMRRINIHSAAEFDEKQFRSWIKQAASMKGWGTV